MAMRLLKTPAVKPNEKNWVAINAEGMRLGRLAANVARVLAGKHKAEWTPNYDHGDYVVVYNTDLIECTTKNKTYWWHTGYPGGIKSRTLDQAVGRDQQSDVVIRLAVKRMLKRSPLGRKMLDKLKCYRGSEHPHQAQVPSEVRFEKHQVIVVSEQAEDKS